MNIEKEIIKLAAFDWLNEFPELSQLSPNRFLKVLGPLLVGIEIVRLPGGDVYRPHFVMYSLFDNRIGHDLISCLSGPAVLIECKNSKGAQIDIPYMRHNVLFTKAVEQFKEQLPLSLTGDVSLHSVISVIDAHLHSSPLNLYLNLYRQSYFYELILNLLVFVDIKKASEYMNNICSTNWDREDFKKYGADVDEWLDKLHQKVDNKDSYLSVVYSLLKEKKISRLKCSDIIPD